MPEARIIVVDADVVQSAGGKDAPPGESRSCRDALEAIREAQTLRVGMSPELYEEWKRHFSAHARRWFLRMHARKRVAELPDPERRAKLRAAMKCHPSEKARDALLKDAHVVELALGLDHRVLSRDGEVRGLLSAMVSEFGILAPLHWVDPCREHALPWLRGGAGDDVTLTLGYTGS